MSLVFQGAKRNSLLAGIILGLMVASPAQAKPSPPVSKFRSAQQNIVTAVANLEAFLRENPADKDAAVARIQLAALKSLQTSATAVLPVPLKNCRANGTDLPVNEWAVSSVIPTPGKTSLIITVHNLSPNEPNTFWAFDRNPLALIDNKGQYYNQLGVLTGVPAGVVKGVFDNQYFWWRLQPDQTINVIVEFEALNPGVTGGKVVFKDVNHGEPAPFSLLNPRQTLQH